MKADKVVTNDEVVSVMSTISVSLERLFFT